MKSGKEWKPYMEIAAACPPQWKFGTRVYLDDKEWTCWDTGGWIVYDEFGYTFVDFLTSYPTHAYEEYVEVYIIPPD